MIQKHKGLFLSFACGLLLVFMGCEAINTDDSSSTTDQDTLADQLRSLKSPDGLTNTATQALTETETGTVADSDEVLVGTSETGAPIKTYVTTVKVNASAKYDTQLLLNPSTDVIYPGSVLVGSSIADGSYMEVVRGEKNDITVSYGGLNGVKDDEGNPGIVSGTIYPSLSKFRELHNQIMGQTFQGANSTYTMASSEVSTESAFEAHFSANVSYTSPSISTSVSL